PALEQDPPAPLDCLPLLFADLVEIPAECLDGPGPLRQEAEYGPREDGLSASGGADKTEDFPALEIEVEILQHVALAEPDAQVAHADDVLLRRRHYMSIPAKKIANKPSSTMTRKIAFTTDAVVCSPSDSAEPATRKPSTQAINPITKAMNGALIMPTSKVEREIASRKRSMKTSGGMPP